MRAVALVMAAGSGARMGGVAKQWRTLAGVPVVARAVDGLRSLPTFVVVAGGEEAALECALDGRPVAGVVVGGATRQASVLAGLRAVAAAGGADAVLIHDAARPLLPAAVVERLLAALGDADGAVPVLPVADTLAMGGDGALGDTIARDGLWRVQTPQAFRFPAILAAHEGWRDPQVTDDAQVARAAGLTVATVAGDPMLDKLTEPADLLRAEAMLSSRLVSRSATGFDVHALEEGAPLWLCGVRVPHSHGLVGHSDADVALHAVTDALLGTVGAGDIGTHFPPSDPQWRGAASRRFLEHAAGLVRAAGGLIDFVDLTLICEAPKIGPHRAAMRAQLAEILRLDPGRLSIKATTTERLGFTGRGEGIAAQAIATVRLPEDR